MPANSAPGALILKERTFMRKKISVAAVLLIPGVLLCGCAGGMSHTGTSDDYRHNVTQMPKSDQLRFPDLPVPAGFSLVRKDSFVFENNRTRLGTLTYKGRGDIDSLINFFKTEMVAGGWTLVNSVEFGQVVLNFVKDQEGCIISLETRTMNSCLLHVSISPLSREGIKVEEQLEPELK